MKEFEEFLQRTICVKEIHATKYAVSIPMYKLDGEQYSIYLVADNYSYYLSDEGSTITELDKIFELNEPDVIKNLVAILKQYGCKKSGSNIMIDCTPQNVHVQLSYLIQCISFMLNMKIFYV
ncbi:hypothetical protein FACS1894188_05420 [Clostridia bacterium]|nr:hypothetical protein FACS1894188_05420 [Clostridia bacterium]